MGGVNYSPLEIELAKMAYRYHCKISKMADEKAKLFDTLYSSYNAMVASPHGADLLHRRAATLASQSKAHFAQAVKLDNELKQLTENKDNENE